MIEAQEGNAEREADALRVVAKAGCRFVGCSSRHAMCKAQIKAAEQKGFDGLPDIEADEALQLSAGLSSRARKVLEQALQAQQAVRFS